MIVFDNWYRMMRERNVWTPGKLIHPTHWAGDKKSGYETRLRSQTAWDQVFNPRGLDGFGKVTAAHRRFPVSPRRDPISPHCALSLLLRLSCPSLHLATLSASPFLFARAGPCRRPPRPPALPLRELAPAPSPQRAPSLPPSPCLCPLTARSRQKGRHPLPSAFSALQPLSPYVTAHVCLLFSSPGMEGSWGQGLSILQ